GGQSETFSTRRYTDSTSASRSIGCLVRCCCAVMSDLLSVVAQPATDVQRLGGHRCGLVADQVADHPGHLAGQGVAPERNPGVEALQDFAFAGFPYPGITLAYPLGHGRLDVAGAHRVHGDPGPGQFEAECLGEADYPV